ncbi:winged helix-turn-helix transcriptional regulator [Micromonospora echinofusca]|uniref:Transcriptional regulator n=1 Tax=Micromonospora echinofusca TaxID=47858 RepID=A0ABS3VTB5_MICEH|nr:helix-turn-helix domain-containing protein [Micromonospora echinofusca]MBO4207774.1 transcriptional regulator [Micromonospora echinofusca]
MTASPVSPDAEPDADDRLVADVFARNCDSRRVLENIAGKWGILALAALHEGAYRFNALRRRVDGVSEKMLSQTLQALERDGLVRRDVQATIPPHVEYSLTPFGARVAAQLVDLLELVESEVGTVLAARAEYDRSAADRKR